MNTTGILLPNNWEVRRKKPSLSGRKRSILQWSLAPQSPGHWNGQWIKMAFWLDLSKESDLIGRNWLFFCLEEHSILRREGAEGLWNALESLKIISINYRNSFLGQLNIWASTNTGSTFLGRLRGKWKKPSRKTKQSSFFRTVLIEYKLFFMFCLIIFVKF